MQFVIENVSKNSGRLGYLVQRETAHKFPTPILIQTTQGGSIPYLSREVFDYVTNIKHIMQMSLSTMDTMAEALLLFDGGVAAYSGFSDYPVLLTIRDPCERMLNGYNEKGIVPMFTKRGKESLTGKKYMDLVEIFRPDIYQGLNDCDTNIDSPGKRIQKSVERTTQFMDYCYDRRRDSKILRNSCMFAPIVGGFDIFARQQSIKHCKSKSDDLYGGYIFEGFHNYGETATAVTWLQLSTIIESSLVLLDSKKPIMFPGAYTPLVMLELIRCGVDIFDTSYAYCAAVTFKALSFAFQQSSADVKESTTPFLDLADDCYKEDFTPIVKDCVCLTCRKHSRAYLYHLFVTSELLGPILLMIHNLEHMMQFFKVIRSRITEDTLPVLINLIRYQNGNKEINYEIPQSKIPNKNSLNKGFAVRK